MPEGADPQSVPSLCLAASLPVHFGSIYSLTGVIRGSALVFYMAPPLYGYFKLPAD